MPDPWGIFIFQVVAPYPAVHLLLEQKKYSRGSGGCIFSMSTYIPWCVVNSSGDAALNQCSCFQGFCLLMGT